MNTHTDTEAHNSFSGILNIEKYFPFLRKISGNFLENFLRNIFPENNITSWNRATDPRPAAAAMQVVVRAVLLRRPQ